jgi:hypothetical protein
MAPDRVPAEENPSLSRKNVVSAAFEAGGIWKKKGGNALAL